MSFAREKGTRADKLYRAERNDFIENMPKEDKDQALKPGTTILEIYEKKKQRTWVFLRLLSP